MRLIRSDDDLAEGLAALARTDPRLAPVLAAAGAVPLRRMEPGFAGLVSIVISQQVSKASADAIFGRLVTLVDPLTPQAISEAREEVFRAAGLSRPKQRTVLALADAVIRDGLDPPELCRLEPGEATARLTAIPGIGPWTAEIYLLFCAGQPDIFPVRDLALQVAVAHALGLPDRPAPTALGTIAESWSPWRSAAARLFWAYYRTISGRDAAPAPGSRQ